MAGYLERYGAGEEQRERRIRRVLLSIAVIAALAGTFYLLFRNYRETKQAKRFFELLLEKDYKAAYVLWGCDKPGAPACHDYTFDNFMEDWGPKSPHADLSSLEFGKVRGCSTGVIVTVEFGKGREDLLWVDRDTKVIGFAPWPVCNPRLPASGTL
ncbi:MAG TPA: hypothetical protein VLE22_03075 [Bryobacteraceae bacterium]|nr:hypothetical protein [Bryobacteraceae bacterium]